MHNSGGKSTTAYRDLREKGIALKAEGRLPEAAGTYQRMFDQDPKDLVTVRQLLILYRKLKEYRKELAVINAVMAAQDNYIQEQRDKWLSKHPRAARTGRTLLKQLEAKGEKVHDDPLMAALKKRKETVMKRLGRKVKGSRGKSVKRAARKGAARNGAAPARVARKGVARKRTARKGTTKK
jgi:tetratricopeptide (TPR) repeat protein